MLQLFGRIVKQFASTHGDPAAQILLKLINESSPNRLGQALPLLADNSGHPHWAGTAALVQLAGLKAVRSVQNQAAFLGVSMYMVYWTEIIDDTRNPYQALFSQADLRAALQFMEKLRQRQRAGESVCFVVMSSENPDSVGHAGAADPHPDYNWMKRRKQ